MKRLAILLLPALLAACPKKDGDGAPDGSASAPKPAVSAPVLTFEQKVALTKPLVIKTEEQAIPGGKVVAERCEVEGGPFVTKSGMNVFRSVRVVGDRLYVARGEENKAIYAYKIDPGPVCKLKLDTTWNGGSQAYDRVEVLSRDLAGNIWASDGIFGAKRYGKDGRENGKCDSKPLGYLYTDAAGKHGIGTFANSNVAKVTIDASGGCKTEAWVFTDLSTDGKRKGPLKSAQAAGFVGDTIFLGGSLAEGDGAVVVLALDAQGKEKFRMGKTDKSYSADDRFGWVHDIHACKAGVCVLDSNYRRVTMWKTTGAFVGSVNLSKLFGLKYPWINAFDQDKDTSWFITGQDREGASGVGEGNIYRVKGI